MSDFRRLTKLYIPCLAGLLFLLTLGVPRASADTITYDLTVPNIALGAVATGPYATVTVTLNSPTSATVTITAADGFVLGGHAAIALNINGTATTVLPTSFTVPAGFGTPLPQGIGSGNVSDFGWFDFVLTDFDGYTRGVTSLTFDLNAATGTSWASAASVLTPNSDGYVAAAHIFPCDPEHGCVPAYGAMDTGYAGNGVPIPEPASIALFGSGLIGLAGLVRRRRRK